MLPEQLANTSPTTIPYEKKQSDSVDCEKCSLTFQVKESSSDSPGIPTRIPNKILHISEPTLALQLLFLARDGVAEQLAAISPLDLRTAAPSENVLHVISQIS